MAVAAGSDIKGFEDLNGKSVAVKTASMSATYAESLADQYGFTVTYFEDSPTMYQAVAVSYTHLDVYKRQIVYVDEMIDDETMAKIGPLFEHHECFPRRVNTEFVKVLDRERVQMRVWERGTGETLALSLIHI